MRSVLCCGLLALAVLGQAQGHDIKPAEALAKIDFMKGHWTGEQNFNTGGAPMVGTATDEVSEAIGGRYLEERLSTTLPGRKPSDTRHFITFDPAAGSYKAYWFNDSSVGAMELEGQMVGDSLVLTSKPTKTGAGQSSVMRATYSSPSADKLVFKLELQQGDDWQLLFTSTYSKK